MFCGMWGRQTVGVIVWNTVYAAERIEVNSINPVWMTTLPLRIPRRVHVAAV